jgi:autotransporter passenger strand-loop-strand repeat protein
MGMNIGPGQFKVLNGIDFGSVIYGGGIEFVANGGESFDATINFGGLQSVNTGALAFSTTVNQGGQLLVSYNGETEFATVKGGSEYLKGVSYFSELMNAGTEYVAGGNAYYTTIDANSLQDVQGGGYAESADVKSVGKQIIEWGGSANFTDVQAGGIEVVMSHGLADNTTVAIQGVQDSFGWTNGSAIHGQQTIENGGIDKSTDIFGLQEILAGGITVSDVIHQGALQFVTGEADNTKLYGQQNASQGGYAQGTDIYSGGQLTVGPGGLANQTAIETGGLERVDSGGKELDAVFHGAGTLDLDSASCVGQVDGWLLGARIDLRDIAFGANTSFGFDSVSGMFSITDGQHSSLLQVLGNHTAGDFKLSSDGHGGTFITDPLGGGLIVPPLHGLS